MNYQVNEAQKRCKSFNFMDICVTANLVATRNCECKNWFDNLQTNLWTDYEKLTKQQLRFWQYTVNTRFFKEDCTAGAAGNPYRVAIRT